MKTGKNMDEHEQIREWLYRKREELSISEQEVLEKHLETCNACRAYARMVWTLEGELQSAFHSRWDHVPVPVFEAGKRSGRQLKTLPAFAVTALSIVLILALVLSSPLAEMLVERANPLTPERDPSSSPVAAQITPAVESSVNPTPDTAIDNLIAFVSRRDGNREIYIVPAPSPQVEGANQEGNPVNLTQNPAQDYAPVWSPDGERIAFLSDRSGQPELFVMQADGSQVSRLSSVPGARAYGEPSWSPDGQQLAVQLILEYPFTGEPYTQIYLVATDGSGASALMQTEFPLGDLQPKWSPAGDRIASRTLGIVQAFPRGAAPGGEPEQVRLSRGLENVGTLAWSPDGAHLAYFASCRFCIDEKELTPTVHLIEADGDNPQVLFAFEEQDLYGIGLSWSPDGSQLLLLAAEVQNGAQHLYLIDWDGLQMTRLADLPAGAIESVPGWSPDGEQIVYALRENGEAGIYVLDLKDALGGKPEAGLMRLGASRRGDSSPRWQP